MMRRPFKTAKTHRFAASDSGAVRYRERVRNKPLAHGCHARARRSRPSPIAHRCAFVTLAQHLMGYAKALAAAREEVFGSRAGSLRWLGLGHGQRVLRDLAAGSFSRYCRAVSNSRNPSDVMYSAKSSFHTHGYPMM